MLTLFLIALAFVLLLGIWWLYSRDLIVHAAILLWILFVPYEVWFRANCPGECNIRADLVLLLPPLLVVSFAALVSVAHKRLRKRRADKSPQR